MRATGARVCARRACACVVEAALCLPRGCVAGSRSRSRVSRKIEFSGERRAALASHGVFLPVDRC